MDATTVESAEASLDDSFETCESGESDNSHTYCLIFSHRRPYKTAPEQLEVPEIEASDF
jgi:hypothetical protein